MNENLIEDYSLNISSEKEEYTEEDFINDLSCENSRNVVINRFKNFTEVSVYKRPFFIYTGSSKDNADRTRKFKYDENGVLQIAKENVTFNDYLDNQPRARRRAFDSFIGYCLSNEWDYFITLTFDPRIIDRTKRDDVLYAWELFRKKLQYRFPDVEIIVVTEEHNTDGCLHFHGFIGNCDLTGYLTLAINNKQYLYDYDPMTRTKTFKYDSYGNLIPNKYYGSLIKTEYGDQVYNLSKDIFKYGLNSVIKLREEKEVGDNARIVWYMQKYMSKDYNSVGYNKKSYFRTRNLKFKDKIITKSMLTNTGQILNELLYDEKILKKENDKMAVYLIKDNSIDFEKDNIYSETKSVNLKDLNLDPTINIPIEYGSKDYKVAMGLFPEEDMLDIFE